MSTLMDALLNGTELPADTAAALAHYTEQARQAELNHNVNMHGNVMASIYSGQAYKVYPFTNVRLSVWTENSHVSCYPTAAQARELGNALLRAAEMLEGAA